MMLRAKRTWQLGNFLCKSMMRSIHGCVFDFISSDLLHFFCYCHNVTKYRHRPLDSVVNSGNVELYLLDLLVILLVVLNKSFQWIIHNFCGRSVSLLPSLNNGGFDFPRYSLGSLEKVSDWLTEAFVKQ